MPGCCHGRPLPWTIPDIIEAPRNKTKKRECMTNMNNGVVRNINLMGGFQIFSSSRLNFHSFSTVWGHLLSQLCWRGKSSFCNANNFCTLCIPGGKCVKFNGIFKWFKVDDSMELDVDKFEKTLLGLFPVVKPSDWMNYLGPVFLFFNEAIEEMSGNAVAFIQSQNDDEWPIIMMHSVIIFNTSYSRSNYTRWPPCLPLSW